MNQLRKNRFGHVDRNGKTKPLSGGHDGCVDPDHFSIDIQKRPARVARIDRSVGLDEVLIGLNTHVGAPRGGNNADRHGAVQAERVADRNRPLPHVQFVRITKDRHRQVGYVYLDNRDVALGVAADNLGIVDLIVGKLDLDTLGIPHDMIIGDDITILADQKAGTKTLVTPGLRRSEEILKKRVHLEKGLNKFFTADGRDIDDAGSNFLGYVAERFLRGKDIGRHILDRGVGRAPFAV